MPKDLWFNKDYSKSSSDFNQEIYSKVFEDVDRIETRDSSRIEMIMDACGVYGDASAFQGLYGITQSNLTDELSHNLVAPACDTLGAEVTQSNIRPMAVTVGGDRGDRQNARHMTRYFDAKWDEQDLEYLLWQAVMDCIITGVGVARIYRTNPEDPANDSVAVERIFPGNLIMDDRWCVDTMPREFYVRRFIDRAHLASLYPDKKDQIWSVQNRERIYYDTTPDDDHYVEVIEAIHLASAKGSTDGRKCLCIRNAVLSSEEHSSYKRPPGLVIFRGIPSRMGYWGESIAMRAAPTQLELNKQLLRMQMGHHLISTPKVFVNRQSGIVETHLTNDIGDVIEYDGEPPIFYNPSAFSAEFYRYVERLEERVFKVLGISEMSAVSKKPPGLDSGAALRTYSDYQTRKWVNFVRAFERFCEDIARELVMAEKRIADDYPSHAVQVSSKNKVYSLVKWSKVNLDPERFHCRIFSASALPNTPAGRLQALEEMVKTGVIDQRTFIQLADVPDLESVRDLIVAGDELLEQGFDKMLDGEEGFYMTPEPGMDLAKGRVVASQMAWKERLQEYDNEENIQKLYDWIDHSYKVEKQIEEQAMAAQAMQQQALAPTGMVQGQPPQPGMPPGIMPNANSGMSGLGTQPAAPAPFTGIPSE